MRAPLALTFVFALALVPPALALDAFPGATTWGAADARALVRLPHGGRLHVEATPAVEVGVAEAPGAAQPTAAPQMTPADFDIIPRAWDESWHGLTGTVELQLHRNDSSASVEILAEDEDGGAVLEWPPVDAPSRGVDAPGILAALGIVATAALVWRQARAL